MSRVFVAMGGGVIDSSVRPLGSRHEGYDVTGHAQALGRPERLGGAVSPTIEDAVRVAAQLGIAHYVFNPAESFR